MDLGKLLEEQESSLRQAAEGLATGDRDKAAAGLSAALLSVATGCPEIAILSPLAEEGLRRAFVAPANRILARQLAEAKTQEEKDRVLGSIARTVEMLLQDSLIQVARLQHHTKDEVLHAVVGVEQGLADFRDHLRQRLDAKGVRAEISVVGHHNQVATDRGINIGGSVTDSVLVTGNNNSVNRR